MVGVEVGDDDAVDVLRPQPARGQLRDEALVLGQHDGRDPAIEALGERLRGRVEMLAVAGVEQPVAEARMADQRAHRREHDGPQRAAAQRHAFGMAAEADLQHLERDRAQHGRPSARARIQAAVRTMPSSRSTRGA